MRVHARRSLALIALVVLAAAAGAAATLLVVGGRDDHHRAASSSRAPGRASAGRPATPASAEDLPANPQPAGLPAPSLFVDPSGNDGGACTRAQPCQTFDRAYHAARPGQLVELAGGDYGRQTITNDPSKTGRGCESALRMSACVILRPAAGARVRLGELDLGDNYAHPGPAGLAIVAGPRRELLTTSTNLNQPSELALWGLRQRNLYMTGGRDVAIRGGEIGPSVTPDGTHPEIQRVYGSDPLIVPTRLTIEGVFFHDINTTSKTAHVDCLQIENGDGLVIRGNRFARCGSVGLRISYGADGNDAPPEHLVIENNVFGACAGTPVSGCYYAAQLGVGRDVLVRNNTAAQALQPAGGPRYANGVRYVGNVAPGVACEAGASYSHNVWTQEPCSPTDRRVPSLRLGRDLRPLKDSPALGAGDPGDHPTIDIDGRPRPSRAAPDAGAHQLSR